MRILFLTDNFPPEVNAPATRTYEHCKEWVKNGADVTVLTCAPNFPIGKVYKGYKNKLYSKEVIDGIKVVRVWTYITANKGTIKRTLDYMSFYFSSIFFGLFQKTDLIIGTTPQFFTALAAKRLAKLKNKPWIMEVRDIWPESVKAVGAVKDGPLIRYFEKKEVQCYRSANMIITVTNGIKNKLISRNVPESKIQVFKNGSNTELFHFRNKDIELIKKLKLEGKRIIGHIGTMGMGHKLDFILNANVKITDPNICFIFIGEGAEKENLKRQKRELDLKNVFILDGIPKHEVPSYISIIDICLINAKKADLFLGALPTKIFENAAMGKPILIGLQGEAEELINKYHAGISFKAEDEKDYLEKLSMLINNNEFYTQCVEGCYKLAKDYDRKIIAMEMLKSIIQLGG